MDYKSIKKLHLLLSVSTGFAFIFSSCASTTRAVTDSSGKAHYYVPASYDYRKNYKVPEDKLKKITDSYIGVRYKNGGMDRRGFDCSGFVLVVFRELNHARFPRSTRQLKWVGHGVSKQDARVGDLVFFRGGVFNSVNHVGIYMGNNTFVHSSTSKGVRYDRLDDEYYTKHFAMVRRIF